MKRVGYDADTGRYYFRDSDGSFWQSAEGSEYGELTRGTCDMSPRPISSLTVCLVAELPSSLASAGASHDDDLEAAPTYSNGYQLLSTDPNVSESFSLDLRP